MNNVKTIKQSNKMIRAARKRAMAFLNMREQVQFMKSMRTIARRRSLGSLGGAITLELQNYGMQVGNSLPNYDTGRKARPKIRRIRYRV